MGGQSFTVSKDFQQLQFRKKPIYSAIIIRCVFTYLDRLRCSATVLLKDFPLPSLSLLRKIIVGSSDAVKCAESLKSPDIVGYTKRNMPAAMNMSLE